MKLEINKDVLESFPDLAIGVLILKGMDNSKPDESIIKLLRFREAEIRKEFAKDSLSDLPQIANWRKAYSSFGAKPKKYKCSVEALYRRILDNQDIPSINKLVDLYNYISIKYLLPAGADNLSKIEGNTHLKKASGTEQFFAIGASEHGNPKEGEIIYADDKDTLCRRWNWRECDKTKLEESTTDAILYVESLTGKDDLKKAMTELQSLIKEKFNIEPKAFTLDKDNAILDIDNLKLIPTNYKIEKTVEVKKEKKEKKDKKERRNKSKDKETIHWADSIALMVKERVDKDPKLKELVDKHGYIVYDEKTPSGVIHVGSARGWVIHDCVAKSLRKLGLNARFILSSDDMDPYDKPNKDLDSSWDKHIGKPFKDIPSPEDGYTSFADYYFSQVTDRFEEWGIECELESTGERYEDGSFNSQFKILLDGADGVKAIYADMYGDDSGGANKLPVNVKCPNCGKIATTLATEWNKEKEEVYFECKNGVVDFADGCGHKGWISPYNGNCKFPWKVEWPAKWPMKSVVYEIAGKDHFTKKGARDIACRIAVDVLNYPPPLPSNGKSSGKGYEFFTVGGAKMSTSKGRGFAFKDITHYVPAKMLKYLMVKTRPNSVIDFDPYNDNDLLLLYDRYDTTERVYYGVEDSKDSEFQKRLYELSQIGEIPKEMPVQVSLNSAAMIIQTALFDIDKAISIMKRLGMVPEKMSDYQLSTLKERLEFSKRWLNEFASEQYKFQLNDKVSDDVKASLTDLQKKSLLILRDTIMNKDFKDQKELFEEFYVIKEKTGVDIKEFFKAAYLVIINKEKGPKLAPFLLQLDKEKIDDLIGQIEQ